MAEKEDMTLRVTQNNFFETLKKTKQEEYKKAQKGEVYKNNWDASEELRALSKSSRQVLNHLKDAADNKSASQNSLIHYAALYDDVELCKTLFDLGADLNLQNKLGSTALHLACCSASTECIGYLSQFTGEEDANKIGNTPLHCAILSGDLECVKALINAYSEIKLRDALKRPNLTAYTPGMLSAKFEDIQAYLVEVVPSGQS